MKKSILVTTLTIGSLQTNCYLITDIQTSQTIILDPGDDGDYITQIISDNALKPTMIIATHGHFDHILASWHLQKVYQIPFAINQKDVFLVLNMQKNARYFLNKNILDLPPKIDEYLSDKQLIKLGNTNLEVIATPGHTPGGISLFDKDNLQLFVGDLIFKDGGVGRTDFEYCDEDLLWKSLKQILKLPKKTLIFSGHGESTSIGKELLIHQL